MSPAVYSLALTLIKSSGKDIPSSSKHTQLVLALARVLGGGWKAGFSPSVGHRLYRQAVFPAPQQGSEEDLGERTQGNGSVSLDRDHECPLLLPSITLGKPTLSFSRRGLLPLSTHALTFLQRCGD